MSHELNFSNCPARLIRTPHLCGAGWIGALIVVGLLGVAVQFEAVVLCFPSLLESQVQVVQPVLH